ncbi:MAG: low-specificity L-threonine aldolase [FCB group bacterium]|nr:low-specificity L-threonine aldolase [FCB group bacterium]
MEIIDLRSDTFTQPSDEMRAAIAAAPLGDDVFDEDPTVNALQEKAARLLGKEKALLVSSGTMGNLVSILAHCERGSEVIVGDQSHTFYYEAGGVSVYGGIHSRQLANREDGTLALEELRAAIRPGDIHFPVTRLICLENTHNRCFGTPLNRDYLQAVADIVRRHRLKLHIDGARIFNAAVSLNRPVSDLADMADSVTFCLSKGLSAPVGSVICGDAEFIEKARRIRKSLGGGMRQAGIIAAGGLYALESGIEQIRKDHDHARRLAEELVKLPGIRLDLQKVSTNIVYFDVDKKLISPLQLVKRMARQGVRFFDTGGTRLRLVTHSGVTSADISKAIKAFQAVLI